MPEAPRSDLALEVRDLSRTFGARKALDKVSLELPKGAFLSIFGPNGAGKTTLVKVLTTLTNPSKGEARVVGLSTWSRTPSSCASTSGSSATTRCSTPTSPPRRTCCSSRTCTAWHDPAGRVRELLEAVELDHRRLDPVRTFSRGMLQRLSIARALLHKPEVLFLDEPYSGLDPHAMDILDSLIAQIRAEHTFVMISHDLAKGLELCSHALILAKGKVVFFEEKEAIDDEAFGKLYRSTVGMGVS